MAEGERKLKSFVCRVRVKHRRVDTRSVQKGNPPGKN